MSRERSEPLARTLREAMIPERGGAEARAVAAATEAQGVGTGRVRGRIAIALLGAVLVLGLGSLTPPGRALAERIGDLVGIGGQPTRGLVQGEQAVVIGVGDDARTYSYEVVARTQGSSTCVFVEFLDLAGEHGSCLTHASREALPRRKLLPWVYPAHEALWPDAEMMIQGLTVPEIGSVEVTYTNPEGTTQEGAVNVSHLDAELSKQIGVEDEAGFFVAFLPDGALHVDPGQSVVDAIRDFRSGVEITAYSDLGEEIGQGTIADLYPSPWFEPPKAICSFAEEGVVKRDDDGCLLSLQHPEIVLPTR